MKTSKFILLLLLLSFSFSWSNNISNEQTDPKVGDTLIVKESIGETYNDINFPRLNMVIKRGGVGTYKSVINSPVVITKIMGNKDGSTIVQLERADGKKFFNQMKYVTANYEAALSSGELKIKL